MIFNTITSNWEIILGFLLRPEELYPLFVEEEEETYLFSLIWLNIVLRNLIYKICRLQIDINSPKSY